MLFVDIDVVDGPNFRVLLILLVGAVVDGFEGFHHAWFQLGLDAVLPVVQVDVKRLDDVYHPVLHIYFFVLGPGLLVVLFSAVTTTRGKHLHLCIRPR